MLGLLTLLAASPLPRTVNDGILQPVEAFTVMGPARVCIGNTAIQLTDRETANVTYLGIHSARVQVSSSIGDFTVSECNSCRPLGAKGRSDLLTATTAAYWDERAVQPTYALFPRSASDESGLITRITGQRVTGARADREFLRRVVVSSGAPADCTKRFNYGWSVMFGEEPFAEFNAKAKK